MINPLLHTRKKQIQQKNLLDLNIVVFYPIETHSSVTIMFKQRDRVSNLKKKIVHCERKMNDRSKIQQKSHKLRFCLNTMFI